MIVRMLRRHLSYEPNQTYDIPEETAQLYVANGLAVPAEFGEPVGTPEPVKNKGGRPRNKPKE